jgi:hypothetical protein
MLKLITTALLVLVLGLVMAPAAFAQTGASPVEGESFTHPKGTSVVSDSMYSGGKALKITKSKAIATKQVTISEASTVLVRARADQEKGGSPTLAIRVDGENSGTRRITSTALADYNYPAVTLQPGTHTIGLKGGDLAMGRNVYVDVLTFPTGGPPPDTTAPTGSITSGPSEGEVVTTDSVSFGWQVDEDISNLQTVNCPCTSWRPVDQPGSWH